MNENYLTNKENEVSPEGNESLEDALAIEEAKRTKRLRQMQNEAFGSISNISNSGDAHDVSENKKNSRNFNTTTDSPFRRMLYSIPLFLLFWYLYFKFFKN